MSKPRLLDLFCCEGGAAMGYHRAGFEVVGVDKELQPLYPFEFVQCDAIDYLLENGHKFDAVHTSPPCQPHSTITPDKSKHLDLIPATRDALKLVGKPWVIENVEGARNSLNNPIRLCGSSFNMRVRRHRLFESSEPLMSLPCDHASQGTPLGVYGQHGDARGAVVRPSGKSRGVKAKDVHEARDAMGMPWASWHGCAQAIPPAFTEYLGGQLIHNLKAVHA